MRFASWIPPTLSGLNKADIEVSYCGNGTEVGTVSEASAKEAAQ